MPLNIDAYLKRINYNGSRDPSAETLRALHYAHLLAVPFENLSIHAGDPIHLDDAALFDKIIRRGRGGFCYELNGLFAALLRVMGFEVKMLSARVAEEGGRYTAEFDHMVLVVSIDQPWLVDVGFGDLFRYPLLLEESIVQTQSCRAFRFAAEGDAWTLLARKPGENWAARYRFTQQPYGYADFVPMCIYHQTSMESKFRRDRICSVATQEGRKTLSNMKYIVTTLEGGRMERLLRNDREFEAVLADEFGITI